MRFVFFAVAIVALCEFQFITIDALNSIEKTDSVESVNLDHNIQAFHADPFTVQTANGAVKGFAEQTGPYLSRAFYGIPYAEPPVRFADPVPVQDWSGVKVTNTFSPGCPQECDLPTYACPLNISEDCLYLNIWTPMPGTYVEALPVLFWVHGGHFEYGSGAGPLYDASVVTNTSMTVVVTINYRLGALGWLYLENAGNFGLKDQLLALEWVQTNIAAFGGDPKRVTIYGQSAGGTSVSVMLTSPVFRDHQPPLYSAAIVQSNPLGLPMVNAADGLDLSTRVFQACGCNAGDLNCIRAVPLGKLLDAQVAQAKHIIIKDIWATAYAWAPALGDMVPDEPLNVLMAGNASSVPIIIGTVEEEGRLFVYEIMNSSLGWAGYNALIAATFFEEFFSVAEKYPSSFTGDNRDLMSLLLSDYLFTCPTRAAARGHANKNIVYSYRFNHTFEHPGAWQRFTYCEQHVCHASELPFVFNDMYNNMFPFNADEVYLAQVMSFAWGKFASTGVATGLDGWQQFDVANDSVYEFVTPADASGPITGLRKSFCDFWDQIGYHY